MNAKNNITAGEKGAVLIEFVIVLIPLLILLFGLIEFGLYFYNKAVLTNAAREGTRQGIVFTPELLSNGDVETNVESIIAQVKTISISPSANPVDAAIIDDGGICYRQVDVNYDYDLLLLPNLLGWNPALPVKATVKMRMEDPSACP